ncbi:unnamed protein product, partial [Ilex paraguariensis]
MRVQTIVRKAHLGPVTALAFSQDSRSLVSASLDLSARVIIVKDEEKNEHQQRAKTGSSSDLRYMTCDLWPY